MTTRRVNIRPLLLFLLVACLLAGCMGRNTPRHSLSELRTALLNHDAETALRYLDLDSIVDHMVRDTFARYEARSDTPLEAMGIKAGREVARALSPGVTALLRSQVKKAITSSDETGYFDYIRKASVWYLNITVDGETAVVEPKGKSDVRFRMARTPEGYWRIVEITRK